MTDAKARKAAYDREYYARTHERLDPIRAAYGASHRAEIAAYGKARRNGPERDRILADKRAYVAANREKHAATMRNGHLRRKFGMSVGDKTTMLAAQGGRCLICKRHLEPELSPENVHVDHDHATGMVRGILCQKCNMGLGCFGDDPAALAAAIEYLHQPSALRSIT